uniref:Protein Wnt n=1 Tax=Hofstenia miamia TaxID=442651 RepID=A0A068CMX8_HOFMI|nr:wnt-3 [Hofstenia miamia]
MHLLGLFLLFLAIVHGVNSWWQISRKHENMTNSIALPNLSAKKYCKQFISYKKRQKLCFEKHDLLIPIALGANNAIDICQTRMKNRRWNCSTLNDVDGPLFHDSVVGRSTRELAFLHSIFSASAMLQIAVSCSKGDLKSCSCKSNPATKDQKVSTCPQDVSFARKFILKFANAEFLKLKREFKHKKAEANKTIHEGLVNIANSETGAATVTKHQKHQCKCQGVSGSCATKTCWLVPASLKNISLSLFQSYISAVNVKVKPEDWKLKNSDSNLLDPTESQLVFLDPSINYCLKEEDWHGVSGRQCDPNADSSLSTGSCSYICCDQHPTVEEKIITEKCNCSFIWCCHINCNTCSETREFGYCR